MVKNSFIERLSGLNSHFFEITLTCPNIWVCIVPICYCMFQIPTD